LNASTCTEEYSSDSNAVDSFALPVFTDYYHKYIKDYGREGSPPVLLPKLQILLTTNYGWAKALDLCGFVGRRNKSGVPSALNSVIFGKELKTKLGPAELLGDFDR